MPPESARDRILDIAALRIASDGIDAVRIARIAAEAGVSTALVHYHFATKDALLAAALEHVFNREQSRLSPAEEARTHAGRLASMVEQCLPADGAQRDEWTLWVELWRRATRDPALRPAAERLYARYHAWFAGALQAGIDAGEFEPCDVDAATDRVLALIDGLSVRALVGDRAVTLERIRAEVMAALARELGLQALTR